MEKQIRKTASFIILSFWVSAVVAQPFIPLEAPVFFNNRQLKTPWVGGLNNPQLSQIDLNGDGFQDLHVFDRTGNIQMTFLHEGVAGSSAYTWEDQPEVEFPTAENWMLLKDYNGDSLPDIFAYSDIPGIDGVIAYTGYRDENGRLKFKRYNFGPPFNLASFPSRSGSLLQIFVSRIDYPGIADMDCDGDLDILTFNISGGYVEFYRNLSQEKGYGLDSLIFEKSDDCWGGFFESGITKEVDLAESPGECVTPAANDLAVNFRHSGSTLLVFDPDQDDDMDLALGDLSFNNLNFLHNGGTCEQAWINEQNINFPSAEKPVDLPTFPLGFYLDIDQDGEKDLLAAPGYEQNSENQKVLWWYQGQRNAPDELPDFSFQSDALLVEDMLDLGTNAYPTFVDYNADGLLDLVVGNQGVYAGAGSTDSRLFLFENTGTRQAPAWTLVDEDYLGMSVFNPSSYGFIPVFGDLDGDGDQDLLVGEIFGQLYYGENLAGPGKPIQIEVVQFGYMDIDVGLGSAPALVDINQDGLIDLLVGERNGNVNYFENIGTKGSPQFAADLATGNNNEFFGGISTRSSGFITGQSTPTVFRSGDQLFILLGSEKGNLFLYQPEGDNLSGNWTLLSETAGGVSPGRQSKPALFDINGDGKLEAVIGNKRGGLQLFSTTYISNVVTSNREIPQLEGVTIFPNPGSAQMTIQQTMRSGNWQVQVTNLAGQLISKYETTHSRLHLDIAQWPAGMYLIKVQAANEWTVERFIKN